MPSTVPSSPSRGQTVATPLITRRCLRSPLATRSPLSIIACSTSTPECPHFRLAAANTSAIGLRFALQIFSACLRLSSPFLNWSRKFLTKGRGIIRPRRRLIPRSKTNIKRMNEQMAIGTINTPPLVTMLRTLCEAGSCSAAVASAPGTAGCWATSTGAAARRRMPANRSSCQPIFFDRIPSISISLLDSHRIRSGREPAFPWPLSLFFPLSVSRQRKCVKLNGTCQGPTMA